MQTLIETAGETSGEAAGGTAGEIREPGNGGETLRDVVLDMSHVRLGCLDEYSLMVLFGTGHSLYLTEGLSHDAGRITDAGGHTLYPAYFMTHLKVPSATPLSSFRLWDTLRIGVQVRRFGGTLLDSGYTARGEDGSKAPITMHANSLFILDPGKYRTHDRQVSSPAKGSVRAMASLKSPPPAIRESVQVRAGGFLPRPEGCWEAEPFPYRLELARDIDPGHPLLFAKMPLLMELSEREALRSRTRGRVSEELVQSVRLAERKTFYYGNAFSGGRLTLFTRAAVTPLGGRSPGDDPAWQHTHRLSFETEMYEGGELLAISSSQKSLAFGIREQSLIQDATRMFQT